MSFQYVWSQHLDSCKQKTNDAEVFEELNAVIILQLTDTQACKVALPISNLWAYLSFLIYKWIPMLWRVDNTYQAFGIVATTFEVIKLLTIITYLFI